MLNIQCITIILFLTKFAYFHYCKLWNRVFRLFACLLNELILKLINETMSWRMRLVFVLAFSFIYYLFFCIASLCYRCLSPAITTSIGWWDEEHKTKQKEDARRIQKDFFNLDTNSKIETKFQVLFVRVIQLLLTILRKNEENSKLHLKTLWDVSSFFYLFYFGLYMDLHLGRWKIEVRCSVFIVQP